MLRPSPNHGTQRLPNDDDDDCIQIRHTDDFPSAGIPASYANCPYPDANLTLSIY